MIIRYEYTLYGKGIVFAVEYDPRLPALSKIVQKHWRSMKQVFDDPPMIAYGRPSNLRDKLIKASIPEPRNQRPERIIRRFKEIWILQCLSPHTAWKQNPIFQI